MQPSHAQQSTPAQSSPLSPEQLTAWEADGYVVVPGLFSPEEVAALQERFRRLAEGIDRFPDRWEPDWNTSDPLKRYPRVMHPHRFCDLSRQALLKPRVGQVLARLFGEAAVACQSMFYFKSPGSAGQALHQDNFYLAVHPGTCIAAWTALDPTDADNGGLYVVPGSHRLGVICPDPEKVRDGRSSNLVDPPKGMKAVPVEMAPGDTLFFGGSLIHGSGRNRTSDRWRRSFIGHYMPISSTHVSPAYFPILTFDGAEISYEAAARGGPCGEALGAIANSYGRDAVIH